MCIRDRGQQQQQQGQPGGRQGQQGQQQAQQGQQGQQKGQQGNPGQMPTQQQIQQAQQALQDLSEQMEQMQGDMETMQALQDLEQGLQQCQDGMNCQGGQCQGQGDKKSWGDWASGEGRGGGKRAKDSSGNTGHFRARVKGDVTRGQTVVTGDADGENLAGHSVTEARALIQSSLSEENDPLENVNLPRASREHAQQYFQNLRGE